MTSCINAESSMTSSAGTSKVFASLAEACAWHVDHLPADCGSASLLDLAALWRSRTAVASVLGGSARMMTRIDAHASSGLTGALAQLGCGGRVRARDDLMSAISSGLTGANLLLDNPCKTRSLITLAKRHGVAMTTFDNETEAARIAEQWPEVAALLLVRSDGASGLLGDAALGAEPGSVAGLLAAAKRVGLNVAGVAMADCLPGDMEAARMAISVGRLLGHRMSLLDVGRLGSSVELIAEEWHRQFDDCGDKIRLMCDPTEALLSRSIVVATRVLAKQPASQPGNNNEWRCTVGDSTFGAFSGWRLRVGTEDAELARTTPPLLAVVHADCRDAEVAPDGVDDAVDIWLEGVTGSPDDQLGCLRLDSAAEFYCDVGDWLLWSGVGADESRLGRRASGLQEPVFRCFLQSGRESEPGTPSRGGSSSRSACRTRHSSSCCYSESVIAISAPVSASDPVSSDASAREMCCSVLMS